MAIILNPSKHPKAMVLPYFQNLKVNLSRDDLRTLRYGYPEIEPSDWETFETIQGTTRRVSVFAIASEAYVCFCIDTTDITPRTKARDILKHNYIQIQQQMANLRVIGYCNILHASTRATMINVFQAMDGPKDWNSWHILRPGGKGWEEAQTNNPFFIGVQKLLAESADCTFGASLLEVLFLFEAPVESQNLSSDFKLHMKFELQPGIMQNPS
ncbi:hypothetical protein F4814DRAFT_423313 [Daldinia grandis]|nr:hypothetical protein F4814DRAFT_423313 [Daldinia grandis]